MLSICIPVYNQYVGKLVNKLHRQALEMDMPAELLLLDDGSDEAIKHQNRSLESLPLVKYEELPENVGRSRIRNLLAKRSSYQYLLFIDCDMEVPSGEFLKNYIPHMQENQVVCGGHRYSEIPPEHPEFLHWLVGTCREVRPAEKRSQRPYHSFMTSNFMIDKRLIHQTGFREELNGYGHEDTLLGYALKKAGIPVTHIDNPLFHMGLEPATTFLDKTSESMNNLWRSYRLTGKDPVYARMVTILETYLTLRKWGLAFIFRNASVLLAKPAERHLKGSQPKLRVFDLYKLCKLCRAAR